jgi:hypothetical protein
MRFSVNDRVIHTDDNAPGVVVAVDYDKPAFQVQVKFETPFNSFEPEKLVDWVQSAHLRLQDP